MTEFKAVEGSSIWDVCLNTYGTLNYIVKLMVDNRHPGVNFYPVNGTAFLYDETLVYNLSAQKSNTVKYATS